MEFVVIGLIIVLVAGVIALILYNLSIHKKIKTLSNTREMVANLQVLQDFMEIIGKDYSVDDKINMINDILIEKYKIKYSTIVVFNGAEYTLKASNVNEKFWPVLKNLHTDEMFKDSITTATPKYVTVNNPEEKLNYQKTEMARAKSAMFFPLYIDNIYIGYWIIESDIMHAFDNIDTSVLGTVKENIISVLRTISYQNTIENISRIDQATNLNSGEYLYGKGKRQIDEHAQSAICMFTVTNIEEINKKFGRDIGTDALISVANVVKSNISSDYIFVRYMGPRFVIAFPGIDIEGATSFSKIVKEEIEQLKIKSRGKKGGKPQYFTRPRTNFAIASYYKGTGLEEVTKKLEEYINSADKKESDITCI